MLQNNILLSVCCKSYKSCCKMFLVMLSKLNFNFFSNLFKDLLFTYFDPFKLLVFSETKSFVIIKFVVALTM